MAGFPIKVYFGGEIIEGVRGPEYSGGRSLKVQFNVPPTFSHLQDYICRRIVMCDYVVGEMFCRISIGDPGKFNFNVLSVRDQCSWKYAYEMALNTVGVVHLYVKTTVHLSF